MELKKKKRIHLTGRKAREFYDKIYERDGGHCIWCGVPIEYGVKYHHEPCGIYRSVDYLQFLYGEKGALKE